jgi:putative nucleotidyltransferase with HDIG domain
VRKFPLTKTIREFSSVFHQAHFRLYVVGGAVRDYLLGKPVGDFDFTTDASPDDVTGLFRSVIPTGIEHGTVTVLFHGEPFEVTTFRTETGYTDSRHPDSVTFVAELEEDLSRRDFTVNALAADTANGNIIDLHDGIVDLKNRVMRAIGDPRKRFGEDSLRILRGYRFLSTLQGTFEDQTLEAARELAGTITGVSPERIKDELEKILASSKPSLSLFPMHEHGLLAYILPELTECVGVGQKGSHAFDVLTHSILCCDGAPQENRIVRWAALLHDIGKPEAKQTDSQGQTIFHRHEMISAQKADALLRRLKFSNHDRKRITHLIAHHMFHYTRQWSDAAVRRFISRVGLEYVDDLVALRYADAYAVEGKPPKADIASELLDHIKRVLASEHAFTIKDLAVNGNDLIESGIPKGKTIGIILDQLLETVLDDPAMNKKKRLLEVARRFYESRIKS